MEKEEYLTDLLFEISQLKKRNMHALYRINELLPKATVAHIRQYFTANNIDFEIKQCARCKRTWDIIIRF